MTEIRVPTLGESVTEATIGKWFKHPGDAVAVDEPLVELETDKVTIEVPAPAAGVLSEIGAKDGETVAACAVGAKDFHRIRARRIYRAWHWQGRPRHQRRHAGRDRARRGAADTG